MARSNIYIYILNKVSIFAILSIHFGMSDRAENQIRRLLNFFFLSFSLALSLSLPEGGKVIRQNFYLFINDCQRYIANGWRVWVFLLLLLLLPLLPRRRKGNRRHQAPPIFKLGSHFSSKRSVAIADKYRTTERRILTSLSFLFFFFDGIVLFFN